MEKQKATWASGWRQRSGLSLRDRPDAFALGGLPYEVGETLLENFGAAPGALNPAEADPFVAVRKIPEMPPRLPIRPDSFLDVRGDDQRRRFEPPIHIGKRGHPAGRHPTLADESSDPGTVQFGDGGSGSSRGESLGANAGPQGLDDAVNPSEAQGLIDLIGVLDERTAGCPGRDDQPCLARSSVVLDEPRMPFGRSFCADQRPDLPFRGFHV